MKDVPLVVEFVPGSRITRGNPVAKTLPIVQNGPPGTVVHFEDGGRVPLPTDQIVLRDDTTGAARVGFGGMEFRGIEDDLLVFYRVHDLIPSELLSPERGFRMTLEPRTVARVLVHGQIAWSASR